MSDPPVTTPKATYITPVFASVTAGPYHTEDTLIRIIQEQDIPVYYYACPNTLGGDCTKAQCKYCLLTLRGYISFAGGKRNFVELPESPDPVYSWHCAKHNKELCDNCDIFIEGKTRFRAWEWNIRSRTFVNIFVNVTDPLRHGFFNRSIEKKETRDRRERVIKRNSTRKPYDSANSRARKTLVKFVV